MLGFKKTANTQIADVVETAQCPICDAATTHLYFMQDAETKEKSKWYNCACGVTWLAGECKESYDEKYAGRYLDGGKKFIGPCKYPVEVYAPLIEESMYGRRFLEIGHTSPYQADALVDRGWIPMSIDKNEALEPSEKLIVDDFEHHDFTDQKFNLIWCYHTLECFRKPKEALQKCYDLLPEDGILFLATPDTDFIHTRSSSGFIHWKPQMNRLMWNRSSLTSYLEKLGFNIILCRRNYEHRFSAQDDLHLIAQKKFF